MYIPAVNPLKVLVVTPESTCAGVVFQVKVNVAEELADELALTVVLPVASPAHNTSVTSSTSTIASHVLEQSITTPCSKTHPLASVIVTVCVAAGKFVAVCVVWLPALALHKYVYGAVPPPTVAVASPF